MRKLDWDIVPEEGLVLMTAPEIAYSAPMLMADFRDSFALVYTKTGNYIGMSRDRGLQLGKSPRMVNGIWFLDEDKITGEKHVNVQLLPDVLALERIR
jgi:hypothetical protein